MKKILILGPNLNETKIDRLKKFGEVTVKPSAVDSDTVVNEAKGFDVLYGDGAFLLESLEKLKDIFVVYPYVELGEFNSAKLKENGVLVANSQGGNRPSIIEWVVFMTLELFRRFIHMVRAKENFEVKLQETLVDKQVLIVGKGSIGSKIAIPYEAFGMKVDFFERGDDLIEKSKDADLIVNALNCNSTSKNLLDKKFFLSLKKGCYYLTFVRPFTYDIDGLIESIDKGVLAGAAIDCDPEGFGDTTNDFYQKCLKHEQILVTPHVAFSTKQAIANGSEIAVQNIEAFLNGNPQNILTKN